MLGKRRGALFGCLNTDASRNSDGSSPQNVEGIAETQDGMAFALIGNKRLGFAEVDLGGVRVETFDAV
jgi:hypothetical protein